MIRREFLRRVGAGSAALTLPFLFDSRSAANDGFPKRFVVMFSPNGTIRQEWLPTGDEENFSFRRILAPLEPHKRDILVLDGLNITVLPETPGDGHQQGMGRSSPPTNSYPGDTGGGCSRCASVSFASSISIDQYIANHIFSQPGAPPRRSFEFGVNASRRENVWTRMSYRGASAPVPPQSDPAVAFESLFGGFAGGLSDAERADAQAERQIVDFLHGEYGRFRNRLGNDDRLRLDQHLEGLDDVARRIDATLAGPTCVPPTGVTEIAYRSDPNYPATGRMMMDMLVSALSCDLTRVASIQWDNSVGGQTFPWLGIAHGHHELSHEDTVPNSAEYLTQIGTWYAEQLAYLIERMKNVREGGGTMFDNTCIVWVNELGHGASHTRNNIPIVLAGSAGGAFRTGRFLQYGGHPHNDLWVSMAQAYGIETNTFGNPSYSNGPLARLT